MRTSLTIIAIAILASCSTSRFAQVETTPVLILSKNLKTYELYVYKVRNLRTNEVFTIKGYNTDGAAGNIRFVTEYRNGNIYFSKGTQSHPQQQPEPLKTIAAN